jgi:hypothetical protein
MATYGGWVMTITAGTLWTGAAGTTATTVSVSPTTVGDILVVAVAIDPTSSTITGVSGGGVVTWVKIITAGSLGTGGYSENLWFGIVATTGSSTVTLTGLPGGAYRRIYVQEFSGGTSGVWRVDTATTFGSTTEVTSWDFPSLTPTGSGELWVGIAGTGYGFSTSAPTGFVYTDAVDAYGLFGYSLSAPNPTDPVVSQSNYYYSAACALLIFTPSAVVYSPVGAAVTSSTGTSISISPTAIGDILVVWGGPGHNFTLSGGGVTIWNHGATNGSGYPQDLWWGVITSTGAQTITTSQSQTCIVQQFHSTGGSNWLQDGAGAGHYTASPAGTTGNYPSLNATNTNELYVVMGYMTGGNPTGSSNGFTYQNLLTYVGLTYGFTGSAGAQSPNWSTNSSGAYSAVAMIIYTPSTNSNFFMFMNG